MTKSVALFAFVLFCGSDSFAQIYASVTGSALTSSRSGNRMTYNAFPSEENPPWKLTPYTFRQEQGMAQFRLGYGFADKFLVGAQYNCGSEYFRFNGDRVSGTSLLVGGFARYSFFQRDRFDFFIEASGGAGKMKRSISDDDLSVDSFVDNGTWTQWSVQPGFAFKIKSYLSLEATVGLAHDNFQHNPMPSVVNPLLDLKSGYKGVFRIGVAYRLVSDKAMIGTWSE